MTLNIQQRLICKKNPQNKHPPKSNGQRSCEKYGRHLLSNELPVFETPLWQRRKTAFLKVIYISIWTFNYHQYKREC